MPRNQPVQLNYQDVHTDHQIFSTSPNLSEVFHLVPT